MNKIRDLERRALELLMREDETMDEMKFGDAERDRVQMEIESVVAQYKEILERKKNLDFVYNLILESENEAETNKEENVDSYERLLMKVYELAEEIGYDITQKHSQEKNDEEET